MLGAGLSFVNTSSNICSVSNRLFGVESSVFTCHSLNEHSGVFIDENMWLSFGGINTSDGIV
jgi:hypothetical protein